MPLLGAHLSIAGGFYRAVESAAELGMDTVQVFTNSPSQWSVSADPEVAPRPLAEADTARFRDSLAKLRIQRPIAHSSYLINLGSSQPAIWDRSLRALRLELQRAEQLGITGVVLHPGAATGGSDEQAMDNIVRGLDEIHAMLPGIQSRVLLENTAGQGTCLGWRFEQLAELIRRVGEPDRLGVCFDTCHAFAAGYPLADRRDFLATFREFDRVVGIDRLAAMHLNDSKRELGSRVDRHEHIGQGKIGSDAFSHILRDKRFRDLPMYLETPKGEHEGEAWDAINLRLLRELAA
ncbi:MAG: deoxyribonuclease IV [Planctomycetota bacterium]